MTRSSGRSWNTAKVEKDRTVLCWVARRPGTLADWGRSLEGRCHPVFGGRCRSDDAVKCGDFDL